ncbi:hypothetical protein HW532_15905 [Kaustia mangrovi]|uniref:Integrase n=1 Tax=Kaustia mangrovi TaxID=2593653 RepID=A0A7S8C607_9HYPH|nr:hypothetical protein [Kaustia mangrovi]QPC44045.1 hypothetical protein HW532_15905 [Kaustia mangrovi]
MRRDPTDPLWSPGLKTRQNRDGSTTYYWVAGKVVRDTKGFLPKTARLIGDTEADRAAECRRLTAELREWLAGKQRSRLQFDGTVNSVLDYYERHDDSPMQSVKWCSAESYRSAIKTMRKAIGHKKLVNIVGIDLKRWYRELAKPAKPGGKERVPRAHFYCCRLRDAVAFGVSLGLPECDRLHRAFSEVRLQAPTPREDYLTYDHVVAIIGEAHRRGRHSLALAQAIQYELTLRQKDVIGEWVPQSYAPDVSGIRNDHGKVWMNGLLWSHIDADLILRKKTTKTGQEAVFNLRLYPLVMQELERVPAGKRVGPIIINENTGRPWTRATFTAVWRKIADAVDVPSTVQSRDSRAGGLTELGDYGVDVELMRHHAQHRNISTTGRYNRRTLEKTSRVAELRAAARRNATGT